MFWVFRGVFRCVGFGFWLFLSGLVPQLRYCWVGATGGFRVYLWVLTGCWFPVVRGFSGFD